MQGVAIFPVEMKRVDDISRSTHQEAFSFMGLFEKIRNPREIRQKLGLNQDEFWQKIGVTQSGGSRYEAGRDMPRPVAELLRLVHVEGVDITSINREDIEVISFLRAKHPDLYARLRESVSAETTDSVNPDPMK
jgi:transcriptional regulator with XRE-family HTH domain